MQEHGSAVVIACQSELQSMSHQISPTELLTLVRYFPVDRFEPINCLVLEPLQVDNGRISFVLLGMAEREQHCFLAIGRDILVGGHVAGAGREQSVKITVL